MIYSNSCSYAIHAMTRLALMRPDGFVLLDELCDGTDLPREFVAKIFQDLVRKGLLTSAKGRGGGFALHRPPAQISLYDIMAVVDDIDRLGACACGMSECNDKQPCGAHDSWAPIRKSIKSYLVKTTLQDMSAALATKLKSQRKKLPVPKSPSKPLRLGQRASP